MNKNKIKGKLKDIKLGKYNQYEDMENYIKAHDLLNELKTEHLKAIKDNKYSDKCDELYNEFLKYEEILAPPNFKDLSDGFHLYISAINAIYIQDENLRCENKENFNTEVDIRWLLLMKFRGDEMKFRLEYMENKKILDGKEEKYWKLRSKGYSEKKACKEAWGKTGK